MPLPAISSLRSPPRAALVFALWLIAAWLLLHLYWGIRVDAVLYTMQGLAHLHPELYGSDIFVRYGSQDRFTLFGPLYAGVLRIFGIDHAASLWTAVSQAALFLAAWQLCRRFMSGSLALLALAFLIAFELPYGSQGVFHVVEDFMSARALTEALVLWGMAAAVADQDRRALIYFALALALHPILGAAGLAWYLWSRVLWGRPWVLVVGALSVLALLLLVALLPWGEPLRMDSFWLSRIVGDTPYLLLAKWSSADWSRTLVPWLTLVLAAMLPSLGVVRRVAWTILAVAVAGTALSAIGGDWLHLTWILQAQPWRWQWLAVTLAALLLPLIGGSLWTLGLRGRTILALLAAAHMLRDTAYGPLLLALALVMTFYARRSPASPGRAGQALLLAVIVVALGFGLLWELASRWLSVHAPYIEFANYPTITLLRHLMRDSLLPVLLLVAVWLALFGSAATLYKRALGLLALIGSVLVLPAAYAQWAQTVFTPTMMQAFAPWRARIPAGAEVLLAENPLYAWVFLQRPSYFSVAQLGTTLFSRPAATVLAQRLFALPLFLSGESVFRSNNPWFRTGHMSLQQMCLSSDVRYIVSHQDLRAAPLAVMPSTTPAPYRDWKLYSCDPSVSGS